MGFTTDYTYKVHFHAICDGCGKEEDGLWERTYRLGEEQRTTPTLFDVLPEWGNFSFHPFADREYYEVTVCCRKCLPHAIAKKLKEYDPDLVDEEESRWD